MNITHHCWSSGVDNCWCKHSPGLTQLSVQTVWEVLEMFPLPARAELAGSFPEYQPIFTGLFPLHLPSHHWCSHLPKPCYLVDDQLALEDGQEVPGLLAHCHSHLHSLIPVFLVQLDGIEGTGSDFIHGGVAALGHREVKHAVG